ncbi:MAG: ABC transporter permease [Candidatus Dormibacteraeota bacterium]|nr:ABC transporter permease [Candidatus Dormibacteraeota bacterium]
MMPASMFSRELLVTVARPRALLIKVCVPLILTVPLVAGHAPTFWAAMLLAVLCAMIGTVGAAVGIARARESGLLPRLALVPKPAWRVVGGWAAGSALVDAVQLAPAIAVLLVIAPVTVGAGLALVCDVVAVLLLANALGCAVAAVGAGPGEVLLDTTVLLAPLLFLGGLFTGVPRAGWRWVAATIDPFSYLHAAFIGALGGDPAFGAMSVVLAALITAAGAAALVAVVSPAVLRAR